MFFAVIISAAGLVLWNFLLAPRLAPPVVAVAAVLVGYVFGHSFWNVHLGPIPLTLDRLILFALAGLFAWRGWTGRLSRSAVSSVDWAIAISLAWLTLSALTSQPAGINSLPTSPLWRLIVSFWAPAFLFWVTRHSPLDARLTKAILGLFAGLGVYLAVTAIAETLGLWSVVFPRYIAVPELGLHFGRARGPALNSVSLGVYLSICLWAAWLLIPWSNRLTRAALFTAIPLMALGVVLTLTRSTWLGLACSGIIVLAVQTPRRLRVPVMGTVALASVLAAGVFWQSIVQLEREDTGSVSRHSVQQRTAFAYVSWNMFCDHPLRGVGFGRFYDQKLPYLADRSQSFELESLRDLHHHNTFLGLLTETGMIGVAAYAAVLLGLLACGWRLAHTSEAKPHERALGILLLAAVMVYLPSAVFHDLTFVHSDQWLLFLLGGLAVGCERRLVFQAANRRPCRQSVFNAMAPTPAPAVFAAPASKPPARVSMFGMSIDQVTLQQATSKVLEWCAAPSENACRYVVTPNVDHVVMHHARSDLRAAYSEASMVLADGAPIVAASKLLGKPLPERVAGSDLTPAVLRQAARDGQPKLRVFLLGAAPGIGDRAAEQIRRDCPGVEIVGVHCPPLGFEKDETHTKLAIDAVNAARPDLVIVGLGAPKQELWVHEHHQQLKAKVALCVGATIDFLAGHKQRSPLWMQRAGLEWAHRLMSEPRRLALRYARDAWVFPQLLLGECRATLGA